MVAGFFSENGRVPPLGMGRLTSPAGGGINSSIDGVAACCDCAVIAVGFIRYINAARGKIDTPHKNAENRRHVGPDDLRNKESARR